MDYASLYPKDPRAALPEDPSGGTSLSDVPMKLDMTDPANQAQAANAWSALRARMGNPLPRPPGTDPGSPHDKQYQGSMTMAQISALLHQHYLGFPDASIRDRIINDEGLAPGQTKLHEIASISDAPSFVQPALAGGASGATVVMKNRQTNMASPYKLGGPAQSETYITQGLSPKFKAAIMAHEAVHSWADANFPAFEPAPGQSDISQYNNLGEEPAPHFDPAGAYHDRRMLDSLKADQLATAYGGYPQGWQKQSPWPMVKK